MTRDCDISALSAVLGVSLVELLDVDQFHEIPALALRCRLARRSTRGPDSSGALGRVIGGQSLPTFAVCARSREKPGVLCPTAELLGNKGSDLQPPTHPTSIRRGFACSAFGKTSVITPSRISALILS